MCDLGPGMSYIFTKEWHEAIKVDVAKATRLRLEATKATERREHTLGTWMQINRVWIAHCQKCDCQVVVNSQPMPNGIEIGGKAVAVNCDLKEVIKAEIEAERQSDEADERLEEIAQHYYQQDAKRRL